MKKLYQLIVMGAVTTLISLSMTAGVSAMGPTSADIVGIKPDGTMWQYLNNGSSRPFSSGSTRIGHGWGSFADVQLSDLDGDGNAEAVTQYVKQRPDGGSRGFASGGSVYRNSVREASPFASGEIFQNYAIYSTSEAAGATYLYADLDANGRKDLITIHSNGVMNFHDGTSYGGSYDTQYNFSSPHGGYPAIGWGWGVFKTVVAGDANGDYYDDLVAMKPDGTLWLYLNSTKLATVSSETPSWVPGVQIGHGWGAFDKIMLGDVNNDGYADIIARKPDGTLWQYLNNKDMKRPYSSGSTQIGHGWGAFDKLMLGNMYEPRMKTLTITPASLKMINGASLVNDGGRSAMYMPAVPAGGSGNATYGISFEAIQFFAQNRGRNVQACITGKVQGSDTVKFVALNQSVRAGDNNKYYAAPTVLTRCSTFAVNDSTLSHGELHRPLIGLGGRHPAYFYNVQLTAL